MLTKKTYVSLLIGLMVIGGIAATRPPGEEHPHKNLKILPKNISHEDLDKIMDSYKAALGVKCNYCHAADKSDSTGHHLDFASDDKPEKNIARSMMKMTIKINKKYFNFNKGEEGKDPAVQCITCHHGNANPGDRHFNSPTK